MNNKRKTVNVKKSSEFKSLPQAKKQLGKASQPKLKLSVQYVHKEDFLPTRQQFRRWVQLALEQDAEVTLRIVNETEGQQLNHDYRGKNYPTNVLTFEYGEPLPGLPLMGDIILCAPVVTREAKEQAKDLYAHYAHLTIHGALHMQGYDHEEEEEAEVMEAREIAILEILGISNPYSTES